MKSNIEILLKGGLLRKISPSRQKAEESMKTADVWIKESENNLGANSFMSCLLTSYLAMFHAARAVLFADGFREKSHFAVARYLEDVYQKKGQLEEKWIKLLDYHRELRHNDQYSTSVLITKKEAEDALITARQFVERIGKFLKDKETLSL